MRRERERRRRSETAERSAGHRIPPAAFTETAAFGTGPSIRQVAQSRREWYKAVLRLPPIRRRRWLLTPVIIPDMEWKRPANQAAGVLPLRLHPQGVIYSMYRLAH